MIKTVQVRHSIFFPKDNEFGRGQIEINLDALGITIIEEGREHALNFILSTEELKSFIKLLKIYVKD